MLLHVSVELGNLLALLHEYRAVLIRLLGIGRVERTHILQLVDELPVLVDIHIRHIALIIGQRVGIHLVVVRGKALDGLRVAQPPVLVAHTAVTVASHTRLCMITDEACPLGHIHRAQVRVHILFQHLPACHARILLLVGVKRVVKLHHIACILGYQLFPRVVLLVFIGIVQLIKHLFRLRTVGTVLRIESADAEVVPVFYTALLRTVQRLGILLL